MPRKLEQGCAEHDSKYIVPTAAVSPRYKFRPILKFQASSSELESFIKMISIESDFISKYTTICAVLDRRERN